MKVLVIGSKSQLGRDLLSRLDSPFNEVVPLAPVDLDITDREAVLKATQKESPEVIINCAAYTQVDKAEEESGLAFKVNAEGAANIADAAQTCNAFLIHISTDVVFDGQSSTPYAELDATGPLSIYAKSKLKGEVEILKSGCDFFVIRTSWLYSTHGNNFVDTILRLAKEREVLRVVDDQFGSPTWTVDLAGAIVHILNKKKAGVTKTGIYHYTNSGAISWYDFAVAIIEEARDLNVAMKCESVEPIPTSEYRAAAKRPPYSVLSTDKIERDFDISIKPWRESLRKMLGNLYGERDA